MIKRFDTRAAMFGAAMILVVGTACSAVSAAPQQSLENQLETGRSASYYWGAIEELGYRVTAVNYDTEDYVEYEVVRGDETWEVQIELDDDRVATAIDVTSNFWKADETAEALETVTVSVPAGTRLALELDESISSDKAVVGQQVTFHVVEDVRVGEIVAIPENAVVMATVADVEKAERPQKPGRLMLTIDSLSVRGEQIALDAEWLDRGEGSHKTDQKEIGIGAAVGAVVGAIVEGVPGAVAGIIIGGGGAFLATKGEDVELPDGARLAVELEETIAVPLQ